jgi:hypothetical protein
MHISRVTKLEIQQRCDNLDDVSSLSSIFIIHYLKPENGRFIAMYMAGM